MNDIRDSQPADEAQPVTSVIGANGYIGRVVLAALSANGSHPNAFTRSTPFQDGGRIHPALLESSVIFYLASSITPAIAHQDPQRVAADRLMLQGLLSALHKTSHQPLVVIASSGGSVYDPRAAPPYQEESRTVPASAYGAAKLAQEQDLIASASPISPVILRLANVYGPGQPVSGGYGVIGHWIEAIRAGVPIRMIGSPRSRRDYVHVTDVARAMLLIRRNPNALRSSPASTILNVGSGVPTSLAELHRHLEFAVGRRIDVRYEAPRAFDRQDTWLDIQLSLSTIGWKPEITLPEGLADTWRQALGGKLPGSSRMEII